MHPTLRRWLPTALSGIALAIIGNALWEYALKPSIIGLRNLTLTIGTLGVTKYKDALYTEIAKGFHESSALEAHWGTLTLIAFSNIAAMIVLIVHYHKTTLRYKEVGDEIDRMSSGQLTPSKSLEEIRESYKAIAKPLVWTRRVSTMLGFIVAMQLVLFALEFASDVFTNSAITHYQQMLAIVRPLLTEDQVQVYNSRFARVSSKSNYVELLSDLEAKATRNGLPFPHFDAW